MKLKKRKISKDDIILVILSLIAFCVMMIGLSIATSNTFNSTEIRNGVIVQKHYIPEMHEKKYKTVGHSSKLYTEIRMPEYNLVIRDSETNKEKVISCTAAEYNEYNIGDIYNGK